MKVLFFFLFFSQNLFADSLSQVRDLKLWEKPQWRRILHYKDSESEVDAPVFFLSAQGKTDPQAEFEADFREFLNPEQLRNTEEQSALCRFPHRKKWMQTEISKAGITLQLPGRSCPRFEKWFEALRGTSASLVFSSYFLNNPSSTFGHTLIRINKAASKDGRRYELLDYGVNFAANANTSNPVLYAFRGMLGGFPGTFTTVPYYYKVREYSNSESRDLWEYELSLPQESVDNLVLQIWEVGPTYSDYWYLSRNCSYFMLSLLEAADPNVNLTANLKKFVIPTDTVKAVAESPGLVARVDFRPSVRTELFTRLKDLSSEEKDILSEAVAKKEIGKKLQDLPEPRKRLVLDAAIDDLDYLYPVGVQKETSPEWGFKNKLLAARSQIPEITSPLKIPAPQTQRPELGHGSRRLGTGFQFNEKAGNSYLFDYKFALHDLLDSVVGFPEYAQITFFDLGFAYEEKPKKLELENFNLFEVISLSPYSQFSKSISWRLRVGVEKLMNEQCMGCHAGEILGGAGYTLAFTEDQKIIGYLGLRGGIYYTDRDHRETNFPRVLAGLGPNFIFRARWSNSWNTLFEAWYRKDSQVRYDEYKEFSLSNQFEFSKSWSVRLSGVARCFENSYSAEVYYYY